MRRLIKRVAEDLVSTMVPLLWKANRKPRLLVLMYHRVLPPEHPDAAIEQPGMFVTPRTLDMHLDVLKQHFELVYLDDWVRRATRSEPLPRMACAITFDDGWRDNYDFAFPVLRKYAAPATIFLVSTLTGTDKEFWPNRLARLLSSLPVDVKLPPRLAETLSSAVQRARARGRWDRESLDHAIVLAKRIAEADIHPLLDEVSRSGGAATPVRAVLNQAEVDEMTESGLVRFGSHTRTHYRFRGEVPPEVLEDEIVRSGDEIANTTGRAADLFCYPNGDFTTAAVDVVRRRYAAAVTTQEGWHTPGADCYLIRRVGVHEDVSARPSAFLARISCLI